MEERKKIYEGEDITMCVGSDRYCYFITKVIDQKHLKVKKYCICADFSKDISYRHQDWKYFKSAEKMKTFLKKICSIY